MKAILKGKKSSKTKDMLLGKVKEKRTGRIPDKISNKIDKVRIMIIDDVKETRENIGRLVSLEKDLIVIAEAGDAESGIEIAKKVQPDIILMDINLPGVDGLKATDILSLELPTTSIIIISVQEENYYLRQAMSLGAREFLMKPFTGEELVEAIRRVYDIEQKRRKHQGAAGMVKKQKSEVITVFSGKGGVGKTTITVNLAIALARLTGEKVVVVDLDFQFGDVSLMLNLTNDLTIADLIQQIDSINPESLEDYLLSHSSGIKVLAAPRKPEEAELVKGGYLEKIINLLRQSYRYILIDTETAFQENNLAALDYSDQIILVSVLDLATIKNIYLSLQVMDELNYSKDKIHLVLNRSDSRYGLDTKDIEKSLNLPIEVEIPEDGSIALRAINAGEPFVLSTPRTSLSRSIYELARLIEPVLDEKRSGSFWHKIMHRSGN